MSRPKPTVHDEYPHGTHIEQIVSCEGLFVVLHRFKPFQLRHVMTFDNSKKYGRTVFMNKGHAHRLAERLNKQYKTTDFTVEQLL